MRNWKISTAVTALLCLLCSVVATAQHAGAPVGLTAAYPDSSALRPLRAGQVFPYRQGVALELGFYRQLRYSGLLADSTIDSKNSRIQGLETQIGEAHQLYELAARRADEAERASDRKDVVIRRLNSMATASQARAARPALLRPETWKVGGIGFCIGFVAGAGAITYAYLTHAQ